MALTEASNKPSGVRYDPQPEAFEPPRSSCKAQVNVGTFAVYKMNDIKNKCSTYAFAHQLA